MRERSILSVTMLAIALVIGCSSKANDAALVTSIQSQMFSDQQLRGASLQVTSDHGQVTLDGIVPSDRARLDAFKIATQTPGVGKVNDQMTVEAAPPPEEIAAPPAVKHDRAAMTAAANNRKKKHPAVPDDADSAYNAPDDPPPPPPAEVLAATPAAQPDPAPAPAPAPPPPPEPVPVQVAADTTLAIRMIDGVDSSVNHTGEIFHASLDAPIVVNDEVLVPKGADVYVRLASASSAGRYTG
jgi:hypothetical protein